MVSLYKQAGAPTCTGLKILLPPPKCQNYRRVPPSLTFKLSIFCVRLYFGYAREGLLLYEILTKHWWVVKHNVGNLLFVSVFHDYCNNTFETVNLKRGKVCFAT